MNKQATRIKTQEIKERDWAVVYITQRKKGAHKDTRREADKKICRQKVDINEV